MIAFVSAHARSVLEDELSIQQNQKRIFLINFGATMRACGRRENAEHPSIPSPWIFGKE
jgi:hypothetical protein